MRQYKGGGNAAWAEACLLARAPCARQGPARMRKADRELGDGRLSEHERAVCYAPDMSQGDTAGAPCSYGICGRA
jgi:hypothetical protein